METHPTTDMQSAAEGTAPPQVDAELIFTFANRAPEVILSFDGLAVPTPLFVELNRLGWAIPAVPPPPSSAIDWTPDPTTGTDYTLRPWRVTEFRLDSGNWAQSSERAIGGLTIEVLKRHSVNIADLRGASEDEIQSAAGTTGAAQAAAPAAAGAVGAAAPAVAPTSATGTDVIFVFDPKADGEMAGYRTWNSAQGRKKVPCTWHEGLMSEGAQVPDAALLAELNERGGGAWHLSGDTRAAASGKNALVQMLHPEMSADDPQLSKLLKLAGASATVVPLNSISGGKNAVLICAQIPGHSVEMLGSNLRIRFPELVFREA